MTSMHCAQCPHRANHYTMMEFPLANRTKECYVNPFALHGCYSKYLKPWVSSIFTSPHSLGFRYGIVGVGNLFQVLAYGKAVRIVDASQLDAVPIEVTTSLARFLDLKPFKFATKAHDKAVPALLDPAVHKLPLCPLPPLLFGLSEFFF